MSKNVAYFTSVTEHESGWGSRPDGYLVAISREAFEQKARQINYQMGLGHEFSQTDSDAKLCLVTDEFYKELENKQAIWTFKKTKEWLVES